VRQNQNRSDDVSVGVSLPIPLWNRNQGTIQAAQAQVAEAVQEIGRVENELVERLATAFRDYAAARLRAERYRTAILPKARETYDLSLKAHQGGQFEYLRVLEAQRSVAQANLEYVRALGEAWKAASVISGLALEEHWPAGADKTQPRK
jgi:outer membrane protein, heavy metal efflux system